MGNTKDLRLKVVSLLGDRCSSSDCRWINEDGSRGCKDQRCLQVDHKFGGGYQARAKAGSAYQEYKKILRDPKYREEFQLLCANCNWIKRQEQGETGGGNRYTDEPLQPQTIALYKSRLYHLLVRLQNPSETAQSRSIQAKIYKLENKLGITVAGLLTDPEFQKKLKTMPSNYIVEAIKNNPEATYEELSEQLKVSTATISRTARNVGIHRYQKRVI
jgi:hypothetical protein